MDDNRKKALSRCAGSDRKASSARVRSCVLGDAGRVVRRGSRLHRCRWGWTSRSASAVFHAAASSKSTAGIFRQNHAHAAGRLRRIQKLGGTAAFVDAEHALDPSYAEKLGVNVNELLVSQPDTGEQALEITDMLVRSNAVDLVVIDSVAALTPKAEIEGEMGEMQMGLHARLMSQALRKLTGNISRSNTMVIFINQIRMKIGVMFGNPETTTGGNALKFYSSVRLDIRRIGAIKAGEEVVGNQTRVKS
jgi:recombination protein RecA